MNKSMFMATLIIFLVKAAYAEPVPNYFGDLPDREKLNTQYTTKLQLFDEVPLRTTSNESEFTFRFLWLPAFHSDVMVKIVIPKSGEAFAEFKRMQQFGSKPMEKYVNTIKQPFVETFIEKVRQSDFWKLASTTSEWGLDGAHWLVEINDQGKYHAVSRWSPDDKILKDLVMSASRLADVQGDKFY